MTIQSDPSASITQGRLAWLLGGGIAIIAGTLLGWNSALLEAIATPPALVRAALVAGAVLVGLWLLGEAVRRLSIKGHAARDAMSDRDVAGLIRAVRLVFLAVAAFAAAAGWLVGHPLPFIVALVIAGVDILETTFLLLIVTLRRE